jgi:hypothetical protein
MTGFALQPDQHDAVRRQVGNVRHYGARWRLGFGLPVRQINQ